MVETENVPPDTDASAGLTAAEAADRLRRDGPNRLPIARRTPVWRILVGQVIHFFALMLWVASVLAFLAGMPQLALAIALVVILNGLFAFAQEYRAQRAAERLNDLLPRRATVIREGEEVEINAADLVAGDVVVLRAGDRISADLRVVEVRAGLVDTSTLTGESVPAAVEDGAELFAGTFLVEGEAKATVTAIGTATRLAAIAELTGERRRPTSPLAFELHRVVRTITLIALVVGGLFLAVATVIGMPLRDAFVFAIGVAVALVPEGLLPTVTLSLAIGAQRMARRNALVRHLESVETLGSTTFICTDKTGTLTRNEMSVVEVWTPAGIASVSGIGYEPRGSIEASPEAGNELRAVALAAARCSTGRAIERDGAWSAQGDPMDAAVDILARRADLDVDEDRRARPDGTRYPFDARRRRVSIVAGDALVVKGAPDSVLPRCAGASSGEAALHALRDMTDRGLRVIAVASRAISDGPVGTADETENGLELLGFLGLLDPPRPEAAAAIEACRRAGIRIAMVTGDHPGTAAAVARQVGLLGPDEKVVIGTELPRDDQLLGALVDRDGIVIARVTPEDKLRIARVLQDRGHVIAMTGDGVNDGPALQQADIGVAMGKFGTDVAREASDLVLLDDDFATIVAAIDQGRATFGNIRNFLTYHLTDNVAELTPFVIWALSGGRFPLAIGVMQVLALDIGTDSLPAVALGAERPAGSNLSGPPPRSHLMDRSLALRVFGILGPVEAIVEMTAFIATLAAFGWRPGEPFPAGGQVLVASGAAFSAVVLGQAANAFACRSFTQTPAALGWFTNRLLIAAIVGELALLGVFLFWPPLASLLGQRPPTQVGWLWAAAAFPLLLVADALYKRVRARRRQRHHVSTARAARAEPAQEPRPVSR